MPPRLPNAYEQGNQACPQDDLLRRRGRRRMRRAHELGAQQPPASDQHAHAGSHGCTPALGAPGRLQSEAWELNRYRFHEECVVYVKRVSAPLVAYAVLCMCKILATLRVSTPEIYERDFSC